MDSIQDLKAELAELKRSSIQDLEIRVIYLEDAVYNHRAVVDSLAEDSEKPVKGKKTSVPWNKEGTE